MRVQQQLFDLIQSVTGRRQLLTVPRPLAAFMGSLEGGLFLSQLLYWSDRSTAPDGRHGWFYKSFADWEDETLLSEYKLRKYINLCQERGFLESDVRQVHGVPVTHYRVRLDHLQQQLIAFLHDDASQECDDASQECDDASRECDDASRECDDAPQECDDRQKFRNGHQKPANQPPKNLPHDPPKIPESPSEKFGNASQKFTPSSLTEITTEITAEKRTQSTTKSAGRPLPFRAADWQEVLGELRNQLPAATFEHALQRCRFLRRDGDLILLAARNPYAAEAINHRLRPVVERALNGWLRAGGLTGRPLRVRAVPPSVSRKLDTSS